ncbi:dicarboxylate/amino acid:cation symporter [Pseudonocardia sp. MCCB 268]|nr:dicarboxylate/amino acid:cation symporter [Pseudonocardia cytotoxica]
MAVLLTGLVPGQPVAVRRQRGAAGRRVRAARRGRRLRQLKDEPDPFVAFSRSAFEIVPDLDRPVGRGARPGRRDQPDRQRLRHLRQRRGELAVPGSSRPSTSGCALVLFVVYPVLLKAVAGIGPRRFFAVTWPLLQFAFVSRSSGASLPPRPAGRHRPRRGTELRRLRRPAGQHDQDGRLRRRLPALATIFIAHVAGFTWRPVSALVIVAVAVFSALATAGTTGGSRCSR